MKFELDFENKEITLKDIVDVLEFTNTLTRIFTRGELEDWVIVPERKLTPFKDEYPLTSPYTTPHVSPFGFPTITYSTSNSLNIGGNKTFTPKEKGMNVKGDLRVSGDVLLVDEKDLK